MLAAGDLAPGFSLHSDVNALVSLRSFRGRRVVLYFYPKDDTPGCTVEACGFRDLFPRFDSDGVAVLGVSPDTVARHARFKARHGLPFTLLADPTHETCEAYGVWQEKLFWGRRYMGVVRTTFVIGPEGRVEHVWEQVDHQGHAAEVSAWLRGEPAPARPPKATGKAKAKATGAAGAQARPTAGPGRKAPPVGRSPRAAKKK
jgi:thioredoxin-dependent peroxiredoxin